MKKKKLWVLMIFLLVLLEEMIIEVNLGSWLKPGRG